MPSALIPFCAYQTDMKSLGEYTDDFSFPLCNRLQATILNGRLCYSLTIDPNAKSGSGKRNGLMMVLDTNEERSTKSIM